MPYRLVASAGIALALLLTCSERSRAQEPLLPGGVAPLHSAFSPPLLPHPVASFGAARLGDSLYVYSGHLGPTHRHSLANLSNNFWRLNLHDGTTWEALPCPQRLQSSVLLADGDSLVRVGGMTAKNATSKDKADMWSVATVARFDPLARTWSDLPALPEARSSHAAAIVGRTLYVVGGWMLAGERRVWAENALALDLSAKAPAWKEIPAPFKGRRALQAVAIDGALVVLGGMTWDGEFTSEVVRFDPSKGAWSALPKAPVPGFGLAACAIGRDLYVSGLDAGLSRLSLQGGEPEWEPVTSLMFPRYFHQLIPLGDERLLAVGGVTRPEFNAFNVHLRTTEVLDLREEREPQLSSWVIAAPGRAKNRQGVFLYRDSLWLFGGNNSLAQHDFGPDNFLDEGYRFHLATARFERLPAFPAKRQSMRTIVLRHKEQDPKSKRTRTVVTGMSYGGFGHTGSGTRSWDDSYAFDFRERAWTKTPLILPRSRTQFVLAHVGSATYAFGGLDYDSQRKKRAFRFPTSVLRIEGGKLTPCSIELPQPRRAYGGALLGKRFYLAGGMKAGFTLIKDVDVYDFETQAWSTIPSPRDPRISPHLIPLGGKLYLIGGTTPKDGQAFTPNQRVEVYDPQTRAWSTLIERLPTSVRHMRFFAWRERILCVSTQTQAKALRILVIAP